MSLRSSFKGLGQEIQVFIIADDLTALACEQLCSTNIYFLKKVIAVQLQSSEKELSGSLFIFSSVSVCDYE